MPNPAVDEFSLMETVRDSAKFSDKIDQLITAKKDYEKAKKDADTALADFARQKRDTDNYVNGKKAELQAAQLEHDKVVEEGAKRIETANTQMAEVLRVRAEVNKAQAELDGKERELKAREKALQEELTKLAVRSEAVDKALDLARRQRDHIAKMPQS